MRRAENLTTFMCRLSWNVGASTSWHPLGLSRPVMGLLYLYMDIIDIFTLWVALNQNYNLVWENFTESVNLHTVSEETNKLVNWTTEYLSLWTRCRINHCRYNRDRFAAFHWRLWREVYKAMLVLVYSKWKSVGLSFSLWTGPFEDIRESGAESI